MRLALPGRWMSTASVAAGAVLIALSLGATPQLDRTLAASAPAASPVVLQAAGHGDHDGDGHGHGDHGRDGRGL